MTQPVFKTSALAVLITIFVIGSVSVANTAKAGCEYKSPGECWTNCKTEDDITICDIIKTATTDGQIKPEDRVFSGQYVTKTYSGNKVVKGRVMVRKK